ncbi:hypothetical protein [Rummeliibacillus sp. POC4]|uniref:hypothetical protein n=1 Tax=Rummeliibacillus sp. POC4 TaxID=2305899 RepID=UPI000E6722EC|nr:hypothetical protein [Rummeliibacillus sp. POC4]RIJ63335.1 hypothetical protein D1606_15515 [Rummeliibacillus sp. POC4]
MFVRVIVLALIFNVQLSVAYPAEAEASMKGFANISQKYNYPLIHDKFIIVDDLLIVTTANFTSTQFAWAENYPMKYISNNNQEELIYNTFSEINSFHFINDFNTQKSYINHFNRLSDISVQID